jgi:hypothetical protein
MRLGDGSRNEPADDALSWKRLEGIDMPEGRIVGDNPNVDTLIKDVAALKNDLGRLMEQVRTDATETVSDGARRVHGAIAAKADRSGAAIGRTIESRPIASLLVAFAVGILGSLILAR